MYRLNWKRSWAVVLAAAVAAGAVGCTGKAAREPEITEVAEAAKDSELRNKAGMLETEGQYYVPCFYPEDLLQWSSEAEDLSWCASVIPLRERAESEFLPSLHDGKQDEAQVLAVSIMNSGTSKNPAQGSSEFMGRANMFSFWQYLDVLVYWGGSAGEGIIVPPGPDVTDAGHKNGVKVLGTVFFPQEVHGGKLEWVRQMTAKTAEGGFPAADKLIELADTLGFDGWFLNQETEGGTGEDAAAMRDMTVYLKEKAPHLTVVWYDSMTEDGSINWQNALNDKNRMFLSGADSMFLNFWWSKETYQKEALLEKSGEYAKQHELNPYELYAGVDVQADGIDTPVSWELFFQQDKTPYTSLGLYCPSWTYYSADGDSDLFQERETLFWVNGQGNPAVKAENGQKNSDAAVTEAGQGWPGISSFKKEQSVVTGTPFVTDFSMGHGIAWYADGEKVSDREWNNRSLQDIMPTYRFSLKGEIERPEGAVDYEEAWNGGSCIRFTGGLKAGETAEAELFAAGLLTEQDTVASTVMKSTVPVSLSLRLEFADGDAAVIPGNKPVGKEWTRTEYDLSVLEGKRVAKISLLMTAGETGQAVMKLGHFDLLRKTEGKTAVQDQIKGVLVKSVHSTDGIHASARVSLGALTEDISRYEIYERTGKRRELVKASANPDTYIDGIARQGRAAETEFEIITVNRRGERRNAGGFTLEWGPYPKPIAGFTIDKTLVKPGEELKLKSLSSETAEEFYWKLDGAKAAESREENPTVVYEVEGTYSISLTAKNSSGEDTLVKEGLVVVSAMADRLTEAAGKKPVEVSGFTNEKEAGGYAVDGDVTTKWCAVGEQPHTITIDLGAGYLVSEVEISHAQAGGEGSDYNTRGFTIFAGMDKDGLKEAAVITDNGDAVSRIPVAPVKARYVKVSIDKATQGGDTAARIYEVKIFGIPE